MKGWRHVGMATSAATFRNASVARNADSACVDTVPSVLDLADRRLLVGRSTVSFRHCVDLELLINARHKNTVSFQTVRRPKGLRDTQINQVSGDSFEVIWQSYVCPSWRHEIHLYTPRKKTRSSYRWKNSTEDELGSEVNCGLQSMGSVSRSIQSAILNTNLVIIQLCGMYICIRLSTINILDCFLQVYTLPWYWTFSFKKC